MKRVLWGFVAGLALSISALSVSVQAGDPVVPLKAVVVPAAGAGHSVALTWTAPPDVVSGTTYNAYRLNAACPSGALTGFTKVGSAIAGTTYTDATVGAGNWCYYVTQAQGGAESGPSNSAAAVILPLPPSAVTVSSSQ